MKHYFAFGGLIGFALCFVSAMLAGSSADSALFDACVSSLIVAMLFRWLRGSLTSQFTAVLREREQAAEAEAALASGNAPAAPSAPQSAAA